MDPRPHVLAIGSAVQRAHTTQEGDKHWRTRGYISLCLCTALALLFGLVVEQVYEYQAPNFWILCFIVFLVSGLTLGIGIWRQWPFTIGWSAVIFSITMMAQFELDLAYIAARYPYACDMYAVANGTKHQYQGTSDGLQLVGISSIQANTDYDWDLECDDAVRVLGTKGGRMVVGLLSHSVPFVFLLGYASGIGAKLNTHFGGLLVDYIDLQDFVLLLFENELILAYWNKADMHTDTGGAAYWYLVMIAFAAASVYLTFFPLVKILVTERPSRIDVGGHHVCKADAKRVFMLEAMCSLFVIELPFLFLRLLCTVKFRIITSSLLIKNVLSAVYDMMKILSLGSPDEFLRKYPRLKPLFVLTEFYSNEGLEDFEKSVHVEVRPAHVVPREPTTSESSAVDGVVIGARGP